MNVYLMMFCFIIFVGRMLKFRALLIKQAGRDTSFVDPITEIHILFKNVCVVMLDRPPVNSKTEELILRLSMKRLQ